MSGSSHRQQQSCRWRAAPLAFLRPSKCIQRNLEIAVAVILGLRQIDSAHVHLDCRHYELRHRERLFPLGAQRDESLLPHPIIVVYVGIAMDPNWRTEEHTS